MNKNLQRARNLRRQMTDTERFVWGQLRNRRFASYKFRRQVPIGPYIVDFVGFQSRLILELDGGGHTCQEEYDAQRTQWLNEQGFRVMRVWNHIALTDWDTVAEALWRALQEEPME